MYQRLKSILGIKIVNPETEASLKRWQEQFTHWDDVDAFNQTMTRVAEDQVLDDAEAMLICSLLPQWESQLRAAANYVEQYQAIEPGTVERNLGLGNLQAQAEGGLVLLASAECISPPASAVGRDHPSDTTSTDVIADIPSSTEHSSTSNATPEPVIYTTPTATAVDVAPNMNFGDVQGEHWDAAADRCDFSRMEEWTDEVWNDTAWAYMGAATLVGIADTDWSIAPMELQVYREFLNGSRTFAIDEWTGLLDTHERFRKTFLNATQLGNLGSALVIHDLLMADFPHVWFAEYQEILPRIKARTTADGRFTGSISIRQGQEDNPLHEAMRIFSNQFYCRTTGLQN